MTLNDVVSNLELGVYIKNTYNTIDKNNPVSLDESIIFQCILYYKLDIYGNLDITCDSFAAENYLKKFVKTYILELVVSLRQLIKAVDNERISSQHTQEKFTPINNKEDINKIPVFTDTTNYSDVVNYLTKVDYMKDLKILKEWRKWVSLIVWNYGN